MLMNPNMGFGVFLLEKPKTFSTTMIMEFRIIIHLEQQGRICCLCQQGGKAMLEQKLCRQRHKSDGFWNEMQRISFCDALGRAQHEGAVGLPCLDVLQVRGYSRKKVLKDPLQMQDLLLSFVRSAHFGCLHSAC